MTIPAGSRSGTGTLELTPVADDLVEGDKVVTLDGTTGGFTAIVPRISLTDDDTATLSITGPADDIAEGSNADFTVTLSDDVAKETTVAWTADGNTNDYSPDSGTVTFPAGSAAGAMQTFSIAVTSELISEPTEDFTGTLGEGTGNLASLVSVDASASGATVAIPESDPTIVRFFCPTTTVSEGDSTAECNVFVDPLRVIPSTDLTVDYATADDTASAGSDYTAASGTLTFEAGTEAIFSQTITVPILDDELYEGDETFELSLTNLQGGGMPSHLLELDSEAATVTVTMTITDNDEPPTDITVHRPLLYGIVHTQRVDTYYNCIDSYTTSSGYVVQDCDVILAGSRMTGDELSFLVLFAGWSEGHRIAVTGTPRLKINIGGTSLFNASGQLYNSGGTDKYADCVDASKSYTDSNGVTDWIPDLECTYTVTMADRDEDGVWVPGGVPFETPSGSSVTALHDPTQNWTSRVPSIIGTNSALWDMVINPVTMLSQAPPGGSNSPPEILGAFFQTPEGTLDVGSIVASDPDDADSVVGFTLGGDDASAFTITGDGVISFADAPDYESPSDANRDNLYELTVTATSGLGSRARYATADVYASVTDVEEPPEFEADSFAFTVAEGSAQVGSVVATAQTATPSSTTSSRATTATTCTSSPSRPSAAKATPGAPPRWR